MQDDYKKYDPEVVTKYHKITGLLCLICAVLMFICTFIESSQENLDTLNVYFILRLVFVAALLIGVAVLYFCYLKKNEH